MLARNLGIPLDYRDLIYIIDFPLFIYLLQKHRKKEITLQYYKNSIRIAIAVTAIAAVMLITAPIKINEFSSKQVAQIDDAEIVSRYGFIGHHLYDLLMPSIDNSINKIEYGNTIINRGSSGRRPNIILIQIESLDANIVNYRYRGEYVVPFLHKLTTESLYFPFTLCYRKLGGTSDCEIAVNNSIEPPVDYPLIMDEHYNYPNSVVKVLKKNGYISEAFHGNSGWFYKRIHAYAAMGYDNFFDPKRMGIAEKGWGVPDHEVLNFVEQHLQKVTTPFFFSIISNFEHFTPDKSFEGVEPRLTGRYFASIAYTDRVLGKFIADVQKKYPDTYFFLYGDHTPYVINDGPFRRSVLANEEKMEMVPLFIITPNGQRRYEHDAVAGYLDIAPTILHAAGVPFSYRPLGEDLFADKSLQRPVIYRGRTYERAVLFKEISEELKRYKGETALTEE
jgi:phosphoglycerol transferase MdoB-like AlkP superfamily enzyme